MKLLEVEEFTYRSFPCPVTPLLLHICFCLEKDSCESYSCLSYYNEKERKQNFWLTMSYCSFICSSKLYLHLLVTGF